MTKPIEKFTEPKFLASDGLSIFVRRLRNFNKTEVYRVLRIKTPDELKEIQRIASNDKIIAKVIDQLLNNN